MGSKKFQNRPCIYCTAATATTADHVIARQFVPQAHRANLPKVPACANCNNAKSQIEHYLATVLPFGSRTSSASADLRQEVPKRLAQNVRLHRELEAGRTRVWTREPSGIFMLTMAIPIDGEKLNAYVGHVVRGLMWHHWKVLLDADHFVDVQCLTSAGEKFFGVMSGWTAKNRLDATLGNGVLSYTAAQGIDRDEISVWMLTLFNGAKVSGEGEQATRWGVMTGPRQVEEQAERGARALASLRAAAAFNRHLVRRQD
ncbi:hypothetical protein [Reyranella sp.]|uniref:hypothetical protein n=1 Tax=Reyranella sp. TaxID=1929291 RepID=UPI00273027DE|nr:hypothetical protein [Reyranella sp.]MDP2376003.1 hypothetical protein [Reyranella sp.]